jgi:hypothetical protein
MISYVTAQEKQDDRTETISVVEALEKTDIG